MGRQKIRPQGDVRKRSKPEAKRPHGATKDTSTGGRQETKQARSKTPAWGDKRYVHRGTSGNEASQKQNARMGRQKIRPQGDVRKRSKPEAKRPHGATKDTSTGGRQ